jgi:RNA polymerase sigma-70 factor (ECF subfamily)
VADGSRSFETSPADRTPRLAAVYRSHAPYVWRVLRHIGVADRDLDDAVQETFLVVHRRLDEFEGRASLRTWLYAVAVRVASTQRRTERRELARRENAGAGVHASSTIDPETELGRAEAADILDTLLSELDLGKRTVFVLAEIEGVKVPEISKILGVNVHTVHSRLRLAREGFEAAVRRMQAREDGRMLRSAIRTRMLVERAANDDVPSARRRAAFAALALRIEEGAVPTLAGWQSVSIAAPSLVPAFAAGVIGTIALGWIGATATTPKIESTRRADAIDVASPAQNHETPSPAMLPVELPPTDPTPTVIAEETPRVRPSTRPAARPLEPPPTSTLAAETALLSEALAALHDRDAKAALAALDRFDAEFPSGELRADARKTRRQAMCMNGDEASC